MTEPSKFDPANCVNKGWRPIVTDLIEKIQALKPKEFLIWRVKEKFGGLRFYYTIDRELENLASEYTRAAEFKASRTCEVCGKPGKLREDRMWLLTLCDSHDASEPGGRWSDDGNWDEE